MHIKSLNVEELSREMKRNKLLVIQEVSEKKARQWLFQGERLTQLRNNPQADLFPEGADIFLVCDDDGACQQYAAKVAERGFNVRYLAGGHLAWNQYYHPVLVGFDEQVKVWQIHRLANGYLSYMIAAGEKTLIVDPSYHIDYYLGFAHSKQTDIRCVVDTQVHRDHVSGGARLAAKTSSPYYIPSHDHLQAESEPLEQQHALSLGEAHIEVVVFSQDSDDATQKVGLLVNNQFLLTGDLPLRDSEFSRFITDHPTLKQASDATVVLPAHRRVRAVVNEHGIVATTLGELKKERRLNSATGRSITVQEQQVNEQEIYNINLTQKKIDLDKANELELGITD